MSLPILYSFRRCPYAMRARLALAVSGQQCELREIALQSKPAELLAAWPGGTVPVLVFPANTSHPTLVHSLDIMLWALAQSDAMGGWMQPEQASKANMLALIAEFDTRFKPLLDRYKYPHRFASEWADSQPAKSATDFAQCNRLQGAAVLESLESLLSSQAQRSDLKGAKLWLYGSQASLADMAVLPFVRQYADTDRAWFDSQTAWPHLSQWLQAWEQSALFALIMPKYPLWQTGTNGIRFPGYASELLWI